MTIFHTGEKKKTISENGNGFSVSSSCFTEETFHMTLACESNRGRGREDAEEGGGGKKGRQTDGKVGGKILPRPPPNPRDRIYIESK